MNGNTVVFSFDRRGQADAGDVAPEDHGARQPRKHVAADIVDGAGPLRCFERPRAEVDRFAQQDARGAELLQIRVGALLAGQRDDFVAAAREHVDREAADAAGCAGHDDRAAVRVAGRCAPCDGSRAPR